MYFPSWILTAEVASSLKVVRLEPSHDHQQKSFSLAICFLVIYYQLSWNPCNLNFVEFPVEFQTAWFHCNLFNSIRGDNYLLPPDWKTVFVDIPVEVPLPLSGSGSKIGSKIPNSFTFPRDSLKTIKQSKLVPKLVTSITNKCHYHLMHFFCAFSWAGTN